MATFYVEIDSDNAAFFDCDAYAELARCLHETAYRVSHGTEGGNIRDYKGNMVGKFGFKS